MTTAKERPDLLRELGLDTQNSAALGRVLGTGSIAEATERPDGTMEGRPGSWRTSCWEPADPGHAARRLHRAHGCQR